MYMRCHEKGATFAAPDLLERVPVKRYSSIFAAFPSQRHDVHPRVGAIDR